MELEKSLNEYLEKIEKYLKPLIVSERVEHRLTFPPSTYRRQEPCR